MALYLFPTWCAVTVDDAELRVLLNYESHEMPPPSVTVFESADGKRLADGRFAENLQLDGEKLLLELHASFSMMAKTDDHTVWLEKLGTLQKSILRCHFSMEGVATTAQVITSLMVCWNA